MHTIKGTLSVITGCGSGLGRATLQWFLKRGSGPILGIDRNFAKDYEEKLDLTSEQRQNLILKRHATFDEDVEKSLKEFTETHGTIDNLINVAGVAMAFTLINDSGALYKLSHAKDLLTFNTVGNFNMIRLASRYMIGEKSDSNKTRCIVNTSCISTTKPSIGQSFYAGSKSSLDSLTLCIARDLGRYNIRCNTINVGYFDTPLLRASDSKVCDFLANHMVLCPTRLGHPDEFAHLVQSIVENQMLNGCCIKLDGCAEPGQNRPVGSPGRKQA